MACDCHDLGLLLPGNISTEIHFPDALCGLVTIHKGHVAVHKDQRISVEVILVDRFLDDFDGLLAVVRELSQLLAILEPENHQKALDDIAVELFIVHYENFPDKLGLPLYLFLEKRLILRMRRKIANIILRTRSLGLRERLLTVDVGPTKTHARYLLRICPLAHNLLHVHISIGHYLTLRIVCHHLLLILLKFAPEVVSRKVKLNFADVHLRLGVMEHLVLL